MDYLFAAVRTGTPAASLFCGYDCGYVDYVVWVSKSYRRFGHKFIDNVTAADIRELMLAVEDRDAIDVAKRVHETSGQIFRYAIAHGIAAWNPAEDFNPGDILGKASSANFAPADAKELPILLTKIYGYDGDVLTRFAIRLMAYTFVRTAGLIESQWPEFDLNN